VKKSALDEDPSLTPGSTVRRAENNDNSPISFTVENSSPSPHPRPFDGPIGDLSQPVIGTEFVSHADIRHCLLATDPIVPKFNMVKDNFGNPQSTIADL
jgi:hypothetical protein